MSNPRPFEEFGPEYADWWEAMSPSITQCVNDGNVLRDSPEQRQRDAEADELARRMEDDE